MKLALALILIGGTLRAAHAGPYCGFYNTIAPASESTLPVSPTFAYHAEAGYYGGTREHPPAMPKLVATIEGKRVPLSTRDRHTAGGVIRFYKVKSRKTGRLVIKTWDRYDKTYSETASFTIASDWTAATPTSTVVRATDTRLSPYRYLGVAAAVRVDVPAIAFTLRWRRDDTHAWQSMSVPATINRDELSIFHPENPTSPTEWKRQPWWGSSEAWIGQRMCGMIDTVPLPLLEAGIEAQLTATLPDGSTVKVADLPDPLVLPAKAD